MLATSLTPFDTPPAKAGRFYHSSTAAVKLKRPIGLTQVSRCFNSGLSDPTEILGRVHVSIVNAAAFGARPFPDVQGFTFAYVPAVRAALCGGEPAVHLHQGLAVPFGLILKLTHKLAPRSITDGFRQRPVLLHVLDRQRFDGDYVKLFNEPRRELMQKVGSAVGYFGVGFCHTPLLTLPVVRAFLFTRKRLLLFAQAAVGIFEKARVAHLLAGRERDVGFKPYVYAHGFARLGLVLHRRFEFDADEVAARWVLGDRDCGWFSAQITTPVDLECAGHLRQTESTSVGVVAKRSLCVASRLGSMLPLERRVARPSLEEVGERLFLVAQALLKDNGRGVFQPLVLLTTFKLCELAAHVRKAQRLAFIVVGIRAMFQCPVPDVSRTPEGLRQKVALLLRWVDAVFIGHVLHHLILHAGSFKVPVQGIEPLTLSSYCNAQALLVP